MAKHSYSLRIIVSGYIIRGPLGGMAWHHLQYVQALHLLGHDVFYVEDSDDYPSCFNPNDFTTTTDPSFGLKFITQCYRQLNLPENWVYYDSSRDTWRGPAANSYSEKISKADLFINLSGLTPARPWFSDIPKRVYVDTDPVFTQVKLKTSPTALQHAVWHTDFFTFAENIHATECTIPDVGIHWTPTRQPVVMSNWDTNSNDSVHREQSTRLNQRAHFSTVMQWNSYDSVEWNHVKYGMKSDTFDEYVSLPKLLKNREFSNGTPIKLTVAVGGNQVPVQELESQGWNVRQSLAVTKTLRHYQDFINRSAAEFSVAKHGYVRANTGWFSERSANYLASGRPVIVQDTGFSSVLPCGAGILPFRDMEQAIASIEDVATHYKKHTQAARELASSLFSPEFTLTPILNTVLHSDIETQGSNVAVRSEGTERAELKELKEAAELAEQAEQAEQTEQTEQTETVANIKNHPRTDDKLCENRMKNKSLVNASQATKTAEVKDHASLEHVNPLHDVGQYPKLIGEKW